MTLKKIAYLLFLLLAMALRPALADTEEVFLKKRALTQAHREMFATGDFAKLDKSLNQLQQEYEAGKWKDYEVSWLFYEPLESTDPAFEDLYNKWVSAYPKSYAANYARGIYYYNRAVAAVQFARRTATINAVSQLPRETAAYVKKLVPLAVRDVTAAAALTAKPLMAYAKLIDLHTFFLASPVNGRKILDMANKIAPKNTLARYRYMSAIREAGANLATLKEVVDDARKSGASEGEEHSSLLEFYYEALFMESRFDLLDKEINALQKDYERGKITDATLDIYVDALTGANPANAEKYNSWIKAFPLSYAARQARAKYFLNTAMIARGQSYASEMTQQEVEGLHLYLQQAQDDAKAAAAMTKKPILSYDVMHYIAMVKGEDDTSEAMMRFANTIDPKNSVVRLTHMHSLQTRWGGSLEKMENFLTQSEAAGIDEDMLRVFRGQIIEEKSWLASQAREAFPDLGEVVTGF